MRDLQLAVWLEAKERDDLALMDVWVFSPLFHEDDEEMDEICAMWAPTDPTRPFDRTTERLRLPPSYSLDPSGVLRRVTLWVSSWNRGLRASKRRFRRFSRDAERCS